MTLHEIFTEIAQHMIKGVMTHEQFSQYYLFLGLNGYSKCHYYHYLAETKSFCKLCKYYIAHHNKLIDEGRIENPHIIPDSWYSYTRQDVDSATARKAVKSGLEAWRDWEAETKRLYSTMYSELLKMGEAADAAYLMCLISDVDHELCKVEKYRLEKEKTGYDMGSILAEQKHKKEKYSEKICHLMAE